MRLQRSELEQMLVQIGYEHNEVILDKLFRKLWLPLLVLLPTLLFILLALLCTHYMGLWMLAEEASSEGRRKGLDLPEFLELMSEEKSVRLVFLFVVP